MVEHSRKWYGFKFPVFFFMEVKYHQDIRQTENKCRGVVRRGAKGAKVAFQILPKCCVFIAALSNEKRNLETSFEMIIRCLKCHEFYSVTSMLVARKSKNFNVSST